MLNRVLNTPLNKIFHMVDLYVTDVRSINKPNKANTVVTKTATMETYP